MSWCLARCLVVLLDVLLSCEMSWCLARCLGVLRDVLVSCEMSRCLARCLGVLRDVLVSCEMSLCLARCLGVLRDVLFRRCIYRNACILTYEHVHAHYTSEPVRLLDDATAEGGWAADPAQVTLVVPAH